MKIQIISLPRSGSSYLRSMINYQLNDVDDYFTISEPFNISKKHKLTQDGILYQIKNRKNVLVKNMIFELENVNLNNLFDYIICLTRKNIFEATLSREISLKTNVWDKKHDCKLQLFFDFSSFKQQLDQTVMWNNKIINQKSHKLIFYEDLTFNSSNDLKILNIPIKHKFFYQTDLLYFKKDIVTNYLELKEKSEEYLRNG